MCLKVLSYRMRIESAGSNLQHVVWLLSNAIADEEVKLILHGSRNRDSLLLALHFEHLDLARGQVLSMGEAISRSWLAEFTFLLMSGLVDVEEEEMSDDFNISWCLILNSLSLFFFALLCAVHKEESGQDVCADRRRTVSADFQC